MRTIGIDVGSTSTKYVVMDEPGVTYHNVIPTGWSSAVAADNAAKDLLSHGFNVWEITCVSTGYGRNAVSYADKAVTEITCHGKGANFLFGNNRAMVIDIGGQDTKVISIEGDVVLDFIMNDKCSAGTGRFLEVMANTMGVNPASLCEMAKLGRGITISSMCTVFAESEVISLIGQDVPKQDIAYGIVGSIIDKVLSQSGRQENCESVYLTGGLCECPYIVELLSEKLGVLVRTNPMARYAGAIGAALVARKLDGKKVKKNE